MAKTPASVARHPLHPMLIPFPIGLFVFSLLSDIIFRTGWGAAVWADVAFLTMAGGIIGALLAAVPGLIDYVSIVRGRHADESGRVITIATTHMILNLTIVAFYVVNLFLRTRAATNAALPFWLSVTGVVLLGVSGYLGGSLVFEERVGVAEPEALGRTFGYVEMMEQEVTGTAEHQARHAPWHAPRRAG